MLYSFLLVDGYFEHAAQLQGRGPELCFELPGLFANGTDERRVPWPQRGSCGGKICTSGPDEGVAVRRGLLCKELADDDGVADGARQDV